MILSVALTQRIVVTSILSLYIGMTYPAFAQGPRPAGRAEMGMQSDSVATQILQSALQQSGGVNNWKKVHSAKIRMTLPSYGESPRLPLLLMDDWSTSKTVYRRGFVGKTKKPRDHNGERSFNTKQDGTGRTVPEFDQARVLADHIPAAAIEVILRRSEYVVKQSESHKCPVESKCVDVYRQMFTHGPLIKEQEWIISTVTGLPTGVTVRLPNFANNKIEIWQKVSYNNYMVTNGLSVPSEVEIDLGGKMKIVSQVESVAFNVPFDTNGFDQELAR